MKRYHSYITSQIVFWLGLLGLACIIQIATIRAQTHYVFDGIGSWNETILWSPAYPGLNIEINDTVTVLPGSEVELIPGVICHGLFHNKGIVVAGDFYYLKIFGSLINDGTYEVMFATMDYDLTFIAWDIMNNGTIDLINDFGASFTPELQIGSFYNNGIITGTGYKFISQVTDFENHGLFDDTYIIMVAGVLSNFGTITGRFGFGAVGFELYKEIKNYGHIDVSVGQFININKWTNDSTFITTSPVSYDTLINNGQMIINTGSLASSFYEGGYLENNGYHKIVKNVDNSTAVRLSDFVVNNDSLVIVANTSTAEVIFNTNIINNSVMLVDEAIIQSENQSLLMNTSAAILGGTGSISLTCYNDGLLSPGFSPGIIHFDSLIHMGASTILIEIFGNAGPGVTMGYDQIHFENTDFPLNGNLNIELNNYIPVSGDSFNIIIHNGISGIFESINLPPQEDTCNAWEIKYYSNRITLYYKYDSDSDGIPDCNDLCPNDPLKITPGICGCGTPDLDANGDGKPDCLESDVAFARKSSLIEEGARLSAQTADSMLLWHLGSRTDIDSSVMLMNRRQDALQFGADNTLHMSLDPEGNLGLGKDPEQHRLEVDGQASKSTPGDWLANSDARLKKNILPLNASSTLDKLLLLEGVTYEWNDLRGSYDRPSGKQVGLTAQNVQAVFPGLVYNGTDGFLMTSYGTFDPVFIEAIRSLRDKNLKLEGKIINLKNRITRIERKQIEKNVQSTKNQ